MIALTRIIAAIIALLAVCGCKAADESPPSEGTVFSGSQRDYITEFEALPEARLKALLFRAIRDAGLPCQTVISAEKVDVSGKGPTWRAQCEDRSAHLVRIMPDGTLYVMSRTAP